VARAGRQEIAGMDARPDVAAAPSFPRIAPLIQQSDLPRGAWPSGHVWIGQGMPLGRQPGKWSSPLWPRLRKPVPQCVVQCYGRVAEIPAADHYAQYEYWLLTSQRWLMRDIGSLLGRTLVCDCDSPDDCHGHVLVHWAAEYAAGRVCRLCGCTEQTACGDGCYWLRPGRCSACGECDHER